MDTQTMIKLAAQGLIGDEAEKRAALPMGAAGAIPPPGPPPMDPMAAQGGPTMPPMPGGGPMPPMDPAAMGLPMDPAAMGLPMPPMPGGLPMDPAAMGLPMGPPPEEQPPEEEVNSPETDVNSDGKMDTMVPLEGAKDFAIGIIEATKGKRTANATEPDNPGGPAGMPISPGASIGGPPSAEPLSALPKLGSARDILDQIVRDLR